MRIHANRRREYQGVSEYIRGVIITIVAILSNLIYPISQTVSVGREFIRDMLYSDDSIDKLVKEHEIKYVSKGLNIIMSVYAVLLLISNIVMRSAVDPTNPFRIKTAKIS